MAVAPGGVASDTVGHVVGDKSIQAQMTCNDSSVGIGVVGGEDGPGIVGGDVGIGVVCGVVKELTER